MAGDPDEAAGAALVASMAGGKGGAADRPIDPDEAAGMALVKTLGAIRSEPKAAPTKDEPTIPSDPELTNQPAGIPGLPAEITEPAGRIGSAAIQGVREGFGSPVGQTIFSPEAQAWMDARQRQGGFGGAMAGIGSTAAGDIGTAGGVLLGIPNALFRGAQGAVAQTGAELGAPQLGRDIASIPEAFAGSPNMLTRGGYGPELRAGVLPTDRPYLPRSAAEGNLLIDRPRSTDLPPVNLLAGAPDMATMTVRPGDPQPQSVGAAASRDMSPAGVIDMTPRQVHAYRSNAEGEKLLEPQQPGQADRNAYVPGVAASTAEIEQTVNAAREAKTANIEHPEVSQAAKDQAAANNDKRRQFFNNTAKQKVDVMNAEDARKASAESDYPAAFAGAKEADAAPVIDAIKATLGDKRGKQNTQLNTYVKPLLNRLVNEDGSLKITDPEELYGFREDLNRMRSKASQANDQNLIHVSGELGDIIKVTDKAIEDAAPGYRAYMDNYAAHSRGIDEMQVLQGHELGLYDTQGRMQLSRVQTMMRNIVDSRMAPGLNQYKSITPETMQRLWNLRDDLRRSASAQELARTPGSDTSQTMFDLAKQGAMAGGNLIAHGAAHYVAPIAGPIVLNAIKSGVANRRAAGAQRAGIAKGLGNLNPNLLRPQQD